jgi:alpha/beta hydrolase fold
MHWLRRRRITITIACVIRFRVGLPAKILEKIMFRLFVVVLIAIAFSSRGAAQVPPFPADFHTQDIKTDGATLFVRVGGHGPAVVLIHGFGDTGDMWAPMAAELSRDHTVIVLDLRGMGLSSDSRSLRRALCASWRDAFGIRAVPLNSP